MSDELTGSDRMTVAKLREALKSLGDDMEIILGNSEQVVYLAMINDIDTGEEKFMIIGAGSKAEKHYDERGKDTNCKAAPARPRRPAQII